MIKNQFEKKNFFSQEKRYTFKARKQIQVLKLVLNVVFNVDIRSIYIPNFGIC